MSDPNPIERSRIVLDLIRDKEMNQAMKLVDAIRSTEVERAEQLFKYLDKAKTWMQEMNKTQ